MSDEASSYRVELQANTWPATLGLLLASGFQPGSYIELGAADGYSSIVFWDAGMLRDARIVNIDANPLYEPSLRRIRDAIERYGDRFIHRIYTGAEIAYVERKTNRFERYAGRFDALLRRNRLRTLARPRVQTCDPFCSI